MTPRTLKRRKFIPTFFLLIHSLAVSAAEHAQHPFAAGVLPASAVSDPTDQYLVIEVHPITRPFTSQSPEPVHPRTQDVNHSVLKTLALAHTTAEAATVTKTIPASFVTTTRFIDFDTDPDETTSTVSPEPTTPVGDDFKPKKSWSLSSTFKDLAPFNITQFPGPKSNIAIVKGIPAQASARAELDDDPLPTATLEDGDELLPLAPTPNPNTPPSLLSPPDSSSSSFPPWKNSSNVLQIYYPKGSINPGGRTPTGGSQFYASPIDISKAKNVTFGYKVFFPRNFQWVLGGKLPGLYGGKTSCSGGNAALDCFSTRLMWRAGGAGELYLYAPKDKQSPALCKDPRSVCNADYGLSVGRGSYKYKPGAWTEVSQTVVLNTPGKQDGRFTLQVDGKVAINRTDIYYRGAVKSLTTTKKIQATPTPTRTRGDEEGHNGGGGILGPILGGILGNLAVADHSAMPTSPPLAEEFDADIEHIQDLATAATPVPMTGIFFSTFFGGSEAKYASPKDQYVWFKDFTLVYNS